MKVSGLMMSDKEEVLNYILTKIFLLAILLMVKHMDMEFINGQLEKSMTDSGIMELDKARVFGKEIKESMFILEIGNKIELKDMEHILGLMVMYMKENGSREEKMVRVQTFSLMEINTMVNI